jgi:hypothetical protein
MEMDFLICRNKQYELKKMKDMLEKEIFEKFTKDL